MANKVVNLTIRLKDGVSGVLNRIRGGIASTALGFKKLGSIGASAFRGISRVAVVAVAAVAAVTAALLKVGKIYAIQEKAEIDLANAIQQTGEEVANNLKQYRAFASSLQRVTKYGDEGILSIMAYGLNLGITTDKIEAATKAAIGLAAKFKIDLQTAMMLVGRAALGQTQMLTRYGIVLEETLSPQDKFNKLLEIGADSFSLAEGETRSITAAFQQLKNSLGDAIETFGRGIFGGGGFLDGLKQMRDAVDRFAASGAIEKWANQAKEAFDNIVAVTKIIAGGGPDGSRGELIKAAADVIRAAFVVGSEYFKSVVWPIMKGGGELLGTELGKFVKNLASWGWDFTKDLASTLIQAAPVIGAQIGKAFLDATKKVSDNMVARGEAGRRAREELGPRPQQISGGLFRPPQNQAEIKKYYAELDALTEKYYNENIALQKKKTEEQIQAVADAFVSSSNKTKSIEKPAEIIEKSADGVSGELTDLEKALSDFNKAMSALNGVIDTAKTKKIIDAFIEDFSTPIGKMPQARQRGFVNPGLQGGGGGPNMMGAATLGAKMLGQQSPFRALGKQGGGGSGIDFGVKARVPELTNRQQFEMRKQQEAADKAAREAARSGDPEAAAKALGGVKSQEVPQKLDMIFEETKKQTSIMEERMGGVQGGG